MKKNEEMKMKKNIFLTLLFLVGITANISAQNAVTIGTSDDPRPGALLDLNSTTQGLLLPKVQLNDVSVYQLAATAIPGMMVYNENANITGGSGKGIYVWYGSQWNKLDNSERIVTDVDGNSYHYACFGTAGCWMQENLRVTKYAHSTNVITPKNGTNNTSENIDIREYEYPNLDANNEQAYGLMYTWAAAADRTGVSATEGNQSGQTRYQGLCPDGWHLPSDYEWSQLEEIIAKNATNKYSSTGATTWQASYYNDSGSNRGTHGQKMKSAVPVDPVYPTAGTSNPIADNGFEASLAGFVYYYGLQGYFGRGANFWTSSSENAGGAWNRGLGYSSDGMSRNEAGKYTLNSVRCKKN